MCARECCKTCSVSLVPKQVTAAQQQQCHTALAQQFPIDAALTLCRRAKCKQLHKHHDTILVAAATKQRI
eukprot:20159-Heterococcus_DN1.PRE.2